MQRSPYLTRVATLPHLNEALRKPVGYP